MALVLSRSQPSFSFLAPYLCCQFDDTWAAAVRAGPQAGPTIASLATLMILAGIVAPPPPPPEPAPAAPATAMAQPSQAPPMLVVLEQHEKVARAACAAVGVTGEWDSLRAACAYGGLWGQIEAVAGYSRAYSLGH